jgi:hypothetical protein
MHRRSHLFRPRVLRKHRLFTTQPSSRPSTTTTYRKPPCYSLFTRPAFDPCLGEKFNVSVGEMRPVVCVEYEYPGVLGGGQTAPACFKQCIVLSRYNVLTGPPIHSAYLGVIENKIRHYNEMESIRHVFQQRFSGISPNVPLRFYFV